MKTTPINPETGEIQMFRTMYNYDRNAVSDETGTACLDPTRTQQQFKEETDINEIIRRFGKGIEMPVNLRPPMPEDYEDIGDFTDAMNTIRRAKETFMAMPSNIREKFDNDPGKFAVFFNDEDNRAQAEKWGLVIPKPKEPTPEPVKVPDSIPAPGDKKGVT